MKYIALKGSVLVISLAAYTVLAQTGTVAIWDGPFSYGVGSEWTALASPSLLGGYAPAATQVVNGQTGFDTFCIQSQVTIDPGSFFYPAVTYNFSLSLASIGSPEAFPLTEGTSWLYSQFAEGELAGYDYSNSGTGTTPGFTASRQIDAGALQSAFWYLQGGQSWPGIQYSFGGAGNIYYNEALADLGSVAALETPVTASTDFGVEVMNLTDSMGNPAQNQLVYLGQTQSVPDNGTTFPLLGASVMGLSIVSRVLRKLAV